VTTEPRRWLVLGAAGRLGRVLCAGRPHLLPVDRKGVDATDPDAVALALRFTGAYGVLNLAAAADVARCEREPEWAYLGNVLTARGVALGACRAGKAFVHVSTDYVFGHSDPDGPRIRAPWWPEDVKDPVNVYGRSKLEGERACRDAFLDDRNTRGAIARMSFLADPPGYGWVIGGVKVTKEWIDSAADRLARFLADPGLVIPGLRTVHLVPERETTLDALLHERYPDVPVIPYEEGRKRLPYALPADLRLGGAWRG
jgi:dTDP-4-dehydrorhamnose reductase